MAWDLQPRSTGEPETGRILVGVPHHGQVSTAWAVSLLSALAPHFARLEVLTVQGQPIDVSREILVEHALTSGAEYIYFLDSDVYTAPDTLQRLLAHRLPIVSALYYRRHEIPLTEELLSQFPERQRQDLAAKKQLGMPAFAPAIWKNFTHNEGGILLRSFRPIFDGEFTMGQMVEADAIPFGCCLIKTEVFKQLPRPWFYWSLGRHPSMLRDDLSSAIRFNKDTYGCSEDLYFSLLARKHGYRLACDTSTVVRHESQVIVDSQGKLEVLES